MLPEQPVSLDQVILSSPAVLIGGVMEDTPRVDFVTGNVSLFGFCPGDLTGDRVSPDSLIFGEDADGACRSMEECLAAGEGECIREYRLVSPAGKISPVRDHRVFHRDGKGKLFAWQSTLLDLSGAKLFENESRLAEESISEVLAASRIWAWEYLPETDELVGSGYFPVDGSGPGKIRLPLKKLWRDVLCPEDLPGVEKAWSRLLEGENPFEGTEYEFRRTDGKRGWVAINAFPHRDGLGMLSGITGLTIDITPLKEAHRKAASQHRRLELLRSVSMGLMEDLDTDSLLRRILRSAVEFAGSGNGVISLLEQGGTVLRHRFAVGLHESMVGEERPAADGMSGLSLRERRRVFVNDYSTWDGRIPDPRFRGITANIVLPLFHGPNDFGTVGIHYTGECPEFDDAFFSSLDQFAAAASMALENARLFEASCREIREKILAERRLMNHGRLAAASAVASGYLLSEHLGESALARALSSLATASGAGRAVLFRNVPEESRAEVTAAGVDDLSSAGEDGPVRMADYPLLFDRLASGRTFLGSLNGSGTEGVAAIPIFIRSRFWGYLTLLFPGREPRFSAGELDVLRTAAYNLAVSVVRWDAEKQVKEGYERLRKTFNDVIRTMGFIVGRKDPYTIEHQERVSVLAHEIGAVMGLDPWRLEGLRICSLVHDVGKVEIPGEILSKPGRLTPMEFELIKTHAQSGYDILKEVDFPWPVAEAARQHHERLDGSGYPRGLSGEEILLEARILAVADVVEAMSSHRPYRPSLGIGAPMAEIAEKRGTAFDPTVVDACMEVLRKNPGIIAGEVNAFGGKR